jgi:hypothetical protein
LNSRKKEYAFYARLINEDNHKRVLLLASMPGIAGRQFRENFAIEGCQEKRDFTGKLRPVC